MMTSVAGRPESYIARMRVAAFAGLIVASAAAGPAAANPTGGDPGEDSVSHEIARILGATPPVDTLAGESVDGAALLNFYRARDFAPAWRDASAPVLDTLTHAGDEGLASLPLHLKAIAPRIDSDKPTAAAEGDLLLTDAILRYAAAMRGQRVDPTDIEDDWFVPTPGFDPVDFLSKHRGDIAAALAGLEPEYVGYRMLKTELAKMRGLAGTDWPKVPVGPSLHPGDSDPRILDVRKRLIATGESAADQDQGAVYDATLQTAVARFQANHGLDADGALGPRTVAALNASPAQRAKMIALNMERWRWLPPHLEDRHIFVNVPAEQLDVVDAGQIVLEMKAIVGDVDHPTPALHARLTSLVLNPVWRVPASIATDEILPQLQKNPGYLIANDLELVSDQFVPGSPESQGVGIAWKSMTKMPWPVRQRAGSDNALGRIKFNLPNDDDIYLHDTPKHKLFARFDRALSHGCVRVEDADALALYLLHDKGWTEEQLDQSIATGETKTIQVPKSIPVWLLYFTAWVDGTGTLQFRDDLYDRDQRLAVALTESMRHPILLAHAATAPNPPKKICEGCRIP
jgi:murein L,D-transpeptidase YcbB/YkuD